MADDLQSLLPKHKSDFESVNNLLALGYPEIAPLLPDLLEWLQDGNWPISNIISEFLTTIPEHTAPLIWNVLRGDDYVWKYWCISQLIRKMPSRLAEQFRSELTRLTESPTVVERQEELDRIAIAAVQDLWPT
ncbi:MAG: DUF5071 domain-containing protein [Planctomycetota bacterium]